MSVESTVSPTVRSGRIRRLAIAIVIFLVLYSTGWFFLASKIRSLLDQYAAGQYGIDCIGPETGGFPFLIGVSCKSFSLLDMTERTGLSTAGLRVASRVYNPGRMVAEIDGPLSFAQGDRLSGDARWAQFQLSAYADLEGLARFSAEARDSDASLTIIPLFTTFNARSGLFQLHGRDENGNLALALLLQGLQVSEGKNPPFLPELSMSLETRLDGFAGLLSGRMRPLRSFSGEITSLKIEMAGGIYASLSGPFKIDGEGLMTGQFSASLEKTDEWERVLLPLFARDQNTISAIFRLLKGLAGEKNSVTVNLEVNDGLITLSMLPVGHIPPLP